MTGTGPAPGGGPGWRAPVDVGRSAAAREAAHELARGRYSDATRALKHTVGDGLRAALRWLLGSAQGHTGATGVVVVATILVLALVVLTGLHRLGAPRRTPGAPRDTALGGPSLTAAHLRARSAAAAASGNWTAAVLAGFRAVAAELVERGVLVAVPGLTAAELVEAVAPRVPDAAGPLRSAAAVFGAVSYGNLAAGPDDAATVTAADLAVRAILAGRTTSTGATVATSVGRPPAVPGAPAVPGVPGAQTPRPPAGVSGSGGPR